MDKYAADFALLIFGLCECIGMGWFYGVRRFFNDIRTMISDRLVDNVFFKWWGVLWCALTPAILSVSVQSLTFIRDVISKFLPGKLFFF